MKTDNIKIALFNLADDKYRQFHAKLIPNVPIEKIIGVRTPDLRKFSKNIAGSNEADDFLKNIPHIYYEENNLHAFLIEKIQNFDECISAVDFFLPYVDNWATCDCMSPKIFKKYPDELLPNIKKWLLSEHTYTIRFGIKTLMNVYADKNFEYTHIDMIASINSNEYYVKMAQAWYFATVAIFHYDEVTSLFKAKSLDKWTQNKSIQKAIESYRISDEKKAYLKSLKIV